MLIKVRLLVLGLLSVMVLGVTSTSALAEPGPFWHHRAVGGTGNGNKIEASTPEKFEGEGTGTELTGKIGGNTFELKCNIKAKGLAWNETNQGQAKVSVAYTTCSVVGLSGCVPVVTGPTAPYNIHLAWKYAGNAKELENTGKQQVTQGQGWDAIILPPGVELKKNTAGTEFELKAKESFALIKFPVTNCGVLGGLSSEAKGSTGFGANIALEQFSQEPTLIFPGGIVKQHLWEPVVGKYLPFNAELTFNNMEAKFKGKLPIRFTSQEVGVFET